MTYDPNVFGYVDGQPTYSRDEFIYKKRRRGPITDDAELVAFAEKVTSGWYNAGWRRTFTTYYLGHFGDMTIDDIAAGIRWHYERGTNALADDDTLTQARADIEAARQQAAEAGLPFSERLVEGPEDESNPYTYDGSMTVADYEAAQRARDAHAALVEVVADHYPNATEEAVERVAEAASSMKLSPEAVQRILDAFDNIIEAINRMIEWAVWAAKTIVNTIGRAFDDFLLCRAPPKWRHYALHAKRARVRKKYRNRIRRAFFAALASEGGGSS